MKTSSLYRFCDEVEADFLCRHCACELQQLLCWWQFERWGSRSDVTFELSAGNAATPSEESRKCKAAERCLPSCRHYRFTLNLVGHWDTEATNWPRSDQKNNFALLIVPDNSKQNANVARVYVHFSVWDCAFFCRSASKIKIFASSFSLTSH